MGRRPYVAQVIVQAAWAHPPSSAVADPASVGAVAVMSWNLRPEVVLPLLVAGAVYTIGWWRLSRRVSSAISRARLGLAIAGIAAVGLALLSPLDALADELFVAHMVQHMLLITVAAPALLLADPLPIVMWALPRAVRVRAGRWLTRRSVLGRLWAGATAMRVTWVGYVLVLWGWHIPIAWDTALADRFVHDVEHVTFFIGAVLFWWPVIRPAPRFRRSVSHAGRIVYLVLGAFQTAALGLLLTLAPVVLYGSYVTAVRPQGLSALDDQSWGGVVMWALGGVIDMAAVLVLLHRCLGHGAREVRAGLARMRAREIS